MSVRLTRRKSSRFWCVQDRLARHLAVELRSDSLRRLVCFIFIFFSFEKCGLEKEVLKGNPGAGKRGDNSVGKASVRT